MRRKGPARDANKELAWRELLRRWREGGRSARAFCRDEGLRESAFYFWRRELDRRDRHSDAVPQPGKHTTITIAGHAPTTADGRAARSATGYRQSTADGRAARTAGNRAAQTANNHAPTIAEGSSAKNADGRAARTAGNRAAKTANGYGQSTADGRAARTVARGQAAERRASRPMFLPLGAAQLGAAQLAATQLATAQLTATQLATAQLAAGVEIVLADGRVVRVAPGFDRRTLLDVLGVLEGRGC